MNPTLPLHSRCSMKIKGSFFGDDGKAKVLSLPKEKRLRLTGVAKLTTQETREFLRPELTFQQDSVALASQRLMVPTACRRTFDMRQLSQDGRSHHHVKHPITRKPYLRGRVGDNENVCFVISKLIPL